MAIYNTEKSGLIVTKNKETVILLHCIGQPKIYMSVLSRFLRKNGYDTKNISYRSCKFSHNALKDFLKNDFKTASEQCDRLHIVTHSMGGVLARNILAEECSENLGRVVMLAPPHKGSEVVDYVKNFWAYKHIYGIAGQQLTTTFQKAISSNIKIDYELGIIAGTIHGFIHAGFKHLFAKENDGLVSVESTKLNGMKDHFTVKTDHTCIVVNKTVQRQVLHFLQQGCFKHS